MTRDEIKAEVLQIVEEQLAPAAGTEITEETHFIDDLKTDSLDTVELVMEIEDKFKIDIPDDEAEKLVTVEKVLDYVTAALQAKAAPEPRPESSGGSSN